MKLMKFQHLSPMRIAKMKTAYYCLMAERVKGNVCEECLHPSSS